jgi:pimeloyl-ACP methyl ester carboxylesterase
MTQGSEAMLHTAERPAAPQGRPIVIALHCSGSSGRQWRALQSARDLGVIAPDLIGSGARPAWGGLRPFSLAEEIAPVLGVVAAGAPVHLVGHSYGGAAALRLALQQPAAIASLTLYEPSAFHVLEAGGPAAQAAHREISQVASACVDGLLSGDYAAAAERFVAYWGGGEAWSRMKPEARRAMAASLPTLVLHFRALLGEPTPLSAFARLPCPVLILRGDRSPAPSRCVADLLAQTIPGATRRILPGWDHMAPLSKADELADVIVEFQRTVECAASAEPGEQAA